MLELTPEGVLSRGMSCALGIVAPGANLLVRCLRSHQDIAGFDGV